LHPLKKGVCRGIKKRGDGLEKKFAGKKKVIIFAVPKKGAEGKSGEVKEFIERDVIRKGKR
jgi:hypothetical protein